MPKVKKQMEVANTEVVETPKLELTELQKVAALTNDPALSEHEVEFGGKVYKLVDLPYDDYMKFLVLLQPFLEAVAARLSGVGQPTTMGDIIKHCGKSLPELVYLSLKQVDEDITVDSIKEIGKTPFALVPVVIKQIEKNKVVKDISDFFQQILPLIQKLG